MRFDWYGNEYAKKIAQAAQEALIKCAADLQTRSVNRAPIDTGKLRENCVVDTSQIGGGTIRVGYSPEVDAYSMIQHERLDFNHPRGGEAKFLENPFNENLDKYYAFILDEVRKAL